MTLLPEPVDPDKLEPPGWFDIGAGYGVAFNTRSGKDNDAQGIFVAFKGYPFGRWYSTLKDSKRFVETVKGDFIALLKEERRKRAPEERDKEFPDLKKLLPGNEKDEIDPTNAQLVHRVYEFKYDKTDDLKLPSSIYEYLKNNKPTEMARNELYVTKYRLEGHDDLVKRFSLFAGISAGEFRGGGLDSTLFAMGASYDITPELAFLGGIAFYEIETMGGAKDTDSGPFIAFSLNLNAFRKILSEAAGLGD